MKTYSLRDELYELYQAASGDWCVTIIKYGDAPQSYNFGKNKLEALDFILSDALVDIEDE